MHYRIRVKGHMDSSWQAWFEGLEIEQDESGTTILVGALPDQAALYGVLLKIHRLGVELLSMESTRVQLLEDEAVPTPQGRTTEE